ncbi:MAG TPA: primosomal protein N' [Candidatus Saccharimonadales bacterium]|nr:primosomal protein N' [Candidatus Saccharimonadales bacterium]
MRFYEVLLADGKYHGDRPLTYSSEEELPVLSVVTVPLRNRPATGFIIGEVGKPSFATKEIKTRLSDRPLPYHCLQLAQWMSEYYASSLSDSLRQFAPVKPSLKLKAESQKSGQINKIQLELQSPLTAEQKRAIKEIKASASTTVLLHGETGSGKTRVYLELARQTLQAGKSVILLTPEISLTTQLAAATQSYLKQKPVVLHSQLSVAKRKQLWHKLLESTEPQIVIGPRSALFAPVSAIGLIVVDEAHEPAYKQEQSPRYNALRLASQLGALTGAKVIYGTATPSIGDYYLAEQRSAIVRMSQMALGGAQSDVKTEVVDLKDKSNFGANPFLSKQLIDEVNRALAGQKQALIYLNRRGSARVILCTVCGWQLLCPNCDVSLVYHGDQHLAKCHICGYQQTPPVACPNCKNTDIVYKTIGTKALIEHVAKLFPDKSVRRFDSDNTAGEQLNELYDELLAGKIDILVGTQLLAKGLDLPRLGLVGIVSAESSLTLPDYTAEERTFQLLYQVIGRVGRGHAKGVVVVQTYEPQSVVIQAAVRRDFRKFYEYALSERQTFRFPPFSYLLKLTCRRATLVGAQNASDKLKAELAAAGLPVEIIGPTPSFYARRGRYFYYQLVVKSKQREHLLELTRLVPQDWQIDLDPADLL